MPTATIVAVLVNPADPARAETIARSMQVAARNLGLRLHVLHASTDRDFDAVFASLVQLRAAGLVIGGDPFFNSRSEQLGMLTMVGPSGPNVATITWPPGLTVRVT